MAHPSGARFTHNRLVGCADAQLLMESVVATLAMKKPDARQLVTVLLKRYGLTFAEELHIDPGANTPSALFGMLLFALLASARIGHAIAFRATRVLLERGWTTPQKMAAATWEQRRQALCDAGYARYDERTSTMLGQTSQMTIARYHGDQRKLREAAEADPARDRKLLKEFKGIGDVGVDIFFREVQLAWPELYPFADKKALASAKALGLPPDTKALDDLVSRRRDFARLVTALVRVQLERKHDEIRAEALKSDALARHATGR